MSETNVAELHAKREQQLAAKRQKAAERAVKFIDDNLLTRRQVRDLPAPEYVVEGWLVRKTIGSAFGHPGVGKSAVILDMACRVATGMQWNGRDTTRGNVVYLVGEGLSGMEQRISAWEADNLPRGGEVSNLHLFRAAFPLIEEDDRSDALLVTMKRLSPVLIVVDTQARYTVGLEENSATDMGKFVAYLDELAEKSGACVLVVRHSARGAGHARGSTVVEGAVETEIQIERDKRKKSTAPGTITLTKQKNGPDGIEVPFSMIDAHGSIVVRVGDRVPRTGPDPFTVPAIITPRDAHARRLAWVCWLTWRDSTSGFTRAEARTALQASPLRLPRRESVYKAWARLERDEFLEVVSGSSRFKITEKCITTEHFTDDMADEYLRQESDMTPEPEASDEAE